ncbi:MAG: response regulator [Pelagimonas sp.]|uniref:response regulator n=1 Tax=Pelagimonas sp. TaxID=2073170 RepID=UPI003D6B68B4
MTDGSLRVAIVDDHALFLEGFVKLLSDYPTPLVPMAFNAATQLLKAVDDGAEFDVVIADLAMKNVNGIALIGALKARDYTAPVIVLSGTEDAITRANAEMVGAFRFVHKSASMEEVFSAIQAASSYTAPLVSRRHNAGQSDQMDEHGIERVLLPQLPPQQLKILELMATGRTNRAIGEELSISENTVKTHIKAIFRELSVSTRTAAVQRARELVLI